MSIDKVQEIHKKFEPIFENMSKADSSLNKEIFFLHLDVELSQAEARGREEERKKRLTDWVDVDMDSAGNPAYHLCYKLEDDGEPHMIIAKGERHSTCENCKKNDLLTKLGETK